MQTLFLKRGLYFARPRQPSVPGIVLTGRLRNVYLPPKVLDAQKLNFQKLSISTAPDVNSPATLYNHPGKRGDMYELKRFCVMSSQMFCAWAFLQQNNVIGRLPSTAVVRCGRAQGSSPARSSYSRVVTSTLAIEAIIDREIQR